MTDGPRVAGGAGDARYLVVGTVRRPHGVRGELSVALDTDRPGSVFRTGRALTVGDTRGRPRGQRITIEKSRPFKDGLLIKFREFDGLTPQVDALRGATLLIAEAEAGPLREGEVFYHQLVGLRLLAGGMEVGRVGEVMELPSGVTLVVRREGARELLIPFVREWILRLDVAGGELEIEPPEGLLDL